MSVTFAEITAAADELHRIAQLIDSLESRLRSEWTWLGDAAVGAPVYPLSSLEAMRDAYFHSMNLHGSILKLAEKSGQASVNYAEAEARNANAVDRAGRMKALGSGQNTWGLGTFAALKIGHDLLSLLKTGKEQGFRDMMETALNDGGAYTAGALGPGVAFIYMLAQLRKRDAGSAGAASAWGLRKVADAGGLARPGHLVVRQVPEQEWNPAHADFYPPGHAISSEGEPWSGLASFQAMLGGSNDAYGYPPGSIGVVRVDRPDGSTAWVVHLPGTEDWSTFDSSNPFDMEGNMEGMTAAHQEEFKQQEVLVQELIKESLTASGALPGEDVVLTGHSGGGIHAAAAAADPAFLAEVNVKMIVIAGSPAKNTGVGEGINVVDLQNEDDIVTAVDFGPPAATQNWVTVTSRRPPTGEADDLFGVLAQAHSLENYMDDAAALDQSDDPSMVASRQQLQAVLGAGAGGTAMVGAKWVYQGSDVDDWPKQKGQTPGTKKPGETERYSLGVR
ncbi:PGAP1-like protein [Arthrobacter alpinus]|uniref:PGAP1-like protein n=1 Tax=Arthrobacter alpinus TaxID=656366 RepID=A0A1H5MST6_9MICC|nr:hypothetical protein [Arthrobacter alpinus]SEE92425.1 PGAP1-like protein [Arthrobacter alpinus]